MSADLRTDQPMIRPGQATPLDVFLFALGKTPRKWGFEMNAIRQDGCCPLEVVARTGPFMTHGAAIKMRLSRYETAVVMAAADYRHQTLRRQLLAACGLTENQ